MKHLMAVCLREKGGKKMLEEHFCNQFTLKRTSAVSVNLPNLAVQPHARGDPR